MTPQDARARLEQALERWPDIAYMSGLVKGVSPDEEWVWCRIQSVQELCAAARAYLDATCVWTEDFEGVWQTACGHAWQFNDGGPEDNKQRFCGYCGAKLRPVRVPVG